MNNCTEFCRGWSRVPPLAVGLAILLVLGCRDGGQGRVPVSGTVSIDGKPLTYGSIRFLPIGEGRPSFATIDPQGRFDFGAEGVVRGTNRVEVIAGEQIAGGYQWHAPQKYASVETSGIEEEIAGPASDLNIALTWGGEKPQVIRSSGGDTDPKNLAGK